MTRKEHLNWCKERAIEYVEAGDINGAWASMVSDLSKHDETRGHSAIELGTMMLMTQNLDSKEEMKKFIEGFA